MFNLTFLRSLFGFAPVKPAPSGSGAPAPLADAPLPAAPVPAAPETDMNEIDIAVAKAVGLPADPVGIMARTIWGEARGDGIPGMQAVANVIRTRAAHPIWWGSTVITVCLEPEQFDCWLPDDPNRPKMLAVTEADADYVEARIIAAQVIAGKLPDNSNGGDSYFATSIPTPRWALPMEYCATVGHQKFYRVDLAPLKKATAA